MSDPATVADYIRQAAASRGIDPEVALRVFQQESGFNPAARNVTPREESYGVAQLNVMGGLGAEARKQGIEPSDPTQWPRHVDFALDTVKKDGWRQWYGARDVGIGRWDGVGQGGPEGPYQGPARNSQPAAANVPVFAPSNSQEPTNSANDLANVFQQAAPPQMESTSRVRQATQPYGGTDDAAVNSFLEDQNQQRLFDPRTTRQGVNKGRRA